MHRDAARRTLVADGDKDRALRVRSLLAEHGRRADLTGSLADALSVLERGQHECLVLAIADADGIAGVRDACDRRPGLAVVVLADDCDPALAGAVLHVGAQDCLATGSLEQLPTTIERAVARSRIVERLHASEARYRAIVEAPPGLIAVTFDEQLRVTTLEGQGLRTADRVLDYVGQPAEEVFGAEWMERVGGCWRRALAGERFAIETVEEPDGHSYVTYYAPMHDARGRLVGGVAVGVDVDDRVKAESTLAAYRARHSELAEGVPVGISEFDIDGRCRYMNGRYREIIGISEDQVIGRPWADFPHPDDVDAINLEWETAKAEGREFRLDYRIRRVDGGEVWVAGRGREVRDASGEVIGFLGTISDIEGRRRADQALREATALFTAAFEHAPIGMGIAGVDGRYQQANPALCQLLGRSAVEIIGSRLDEFVHTEVQDAAAHRIDQLVSGQIDEWEGEGRVSRPDGSQVWALLHTTVLRTEDGEPTLLFAQMIDIGKRRSHEDELRHLADHDVLTGLANRRRFEAELTRHIAEHAGRERAGAVLLLDLDCFKSVNDENGHHAGDRVLIDVADVLCRRLRRTDVVGRIGGDEFAVLLRQSDAARAEAVAQMLTAAIAETGITASIGVAGLGDHGDTADRVLVRADLAMYAVKRRLRDEAVAG